MPSEAQQERAISYLMGELAEFEAVQFEQEIASDPELAKLVDELEETMALSILSETEVTEPSADLGDRIVAQLPDRKPTEGKTDSSREPPKRRVPFFAILGWAAAACFMILFYQTNSELETVEKQASVLQQQQGSVSDELQSVMSELAGLQAEKNNMAAVITSLEQQRSLDQMQIADLSSELDSLYEGVTVWDTARSEGIVRVYNLPELDRAQQDYQMWVITGASPDPISAGVFQVDPSGSAEYRFSPLAAIEEIKAFAISRERKGGVTSPQGPIMLSGSL